MFVYPDGAVSGSVNWGRLEELASARSDKSVTADGWAKLDALLAEHNGERPAKRSTAKKTAAKAAPAKESTEPAATTQERDSAPAKKAEPAKATAKK